MKIMILGAGMLQLPAIRRAREMGHFVIALDRDPRAPGFDFADIALTVSTLDIPGATAAARRYGIDGVMTLATDMPVRTAATVAEELGLPGISLDAALKATDKALMRKCLRDHGVPIPHYTAVDSREEFLEALDDFTGPCIVKPADSSGSRGVRLVKDVADTGDALSAYVYSRRQSRRGVVLIEEYMQGPEVSVETFAMDGTVHIIAVTDKLTTGPPFFVEMGHSQPSMLSGYTLAQVHAVTAAANRAIGITDGPSHTEIMVTAGGPKLVELGARLGGDNITTHLTPLSTGVDLVEAYIRAALGQKPDLTVRASLGAAIRYFATAPGVITGITGVDEARRIEGVRMIAFTRSVGDRAGDVRSSADRIGFVIAQAATAADAAAVCERVLSTVRIHTEEEPS